MKRLLCVLMLGLVIGQIQLDTKAYELPRIYFAEGTTYNIDLAEITSYELDFSELKIVKIADFNLSGGGAAIWVEQLIHNTYEGSEWYGIDCIELYSTGSINYSACPGPIIYDGNNELRLSFYGAGYVDIVISVTAPFPEEDTGYIEEGFEFCLHESNNLASYPCDNSIPIASAIPDSDEFLTNIIGEGVAATYQEGLGWIGSLMELQPGNGYWMKSNTDICFNYSCSEE